MLTIEEIIQKEGFYMTVAEGISMLPLIRPKVDTVVIERMVEECRPMDVVLYRLINDKLVLHRVIKNYENQYLICGDNCTALEYIDKTHVIGVLTHFYHGEEKVELNSLAYQLYVVFWCRPYVIRIWILKVKNTMLRILKNAVRKLGKREKQ